MKAGVFQLKYRQREVEVHIKKMRTMRLTVKPPDGRIRVSAPLRTTKKQVETFLAAHWEWVERNSKKVRANARQVLLRMVTGEQVALWGEEHPLVWQVTPSREIRVEQAITGDIVITAPADSTAGERFQALLQWYYRELAAELEKQFAHWESKVGAQAKKIRIRRMKTKWGSCNPQTASISINLELIRYPKPALSYVVLHELVHLFERGHNRRFYALVEKHLPDWAQWRRCLNQKPLVLLQPVLDEAEAPAYLLPGHPDAANPNKTTDSPL